DNLSNIYVYALTIDPVNSDIYYWGSSSGVIFKSTDAGATWNQLADTGSGVVNKILINPTDTSKMFCSSQYDGIYKSTDGGVNWSSIHSDSYTGYDIEFKPGNNNVVYASGNNFFKSTDSGQSFTKIVNNFITGTNLNSDAKMIGVSAADPEVVYLLEASGGVFGGFHKSTDSGDNFTKLDHTGNNYFGSSSAADDDRGQAPRDMDIVVNPNDANDVHIAGILSWRSTDGGVNFNITSQWVPEYAVNENIGYCHADIDIMIYQNNKLYIGSDGGIYVANDPLNVSNTYYSDLSSGLGIRQFYRIGISQTNPVIVTGGAQDNGTSIYRADKTWYDWLGADGMESFVDHSDSNILYGTSQHGSLWKSYNQGQSIIGLPKPDNKTGAWITPFEQDPISSTTVYTGYDQIYKSTNGGENLNDGSQSWIAISQNFGSNANHLKIAPSDSDTMYAAFGSNLYQTTNGGSVGDWTQLTGFSGNINSIAIHPTNPNKLAIATNSSDKVYISSDGGQNWSVGTYDLPSFTALALVWDTNYSEDILYLGMNYGIYYLRDNEITWTSYNTDLPNVQINELEINSADKKIYAATYGRGLWRVELFEPSTLGVNELQTSDLIVFPNPTTGTFKLNWKLNDLVTVKIYDSLGKLVFYEKNRDLSQNSEIELQAPQGLYFLKVNTTHSEITKKLIVK
ncbi:T9SS type A sorting domain-containing protein, partial [Flavobacteriaceae bacterium]|nr:T9SS type A sorting domain-containing protein [Flavobacteriaceae bacterium]